jgi:hypothetical protein
MLFKSAKLAVGGSTPSEQITSQANPFSRVETFIIVDSLSRKMLGGEVV